MTSRATVAWTCTLLLIMGCSRVVEQPFTVHEEIAELPDLHQTNISDGLRLMFGTPTRPRLKPTIEWASTEPEDAAKAEDEADADDSPTAEAQQHPEPAAGLVSVGRLAHGAQVYRARCSGCHGLSGDGAGAAAEYLRPKPRDYRKGVYKFTSTPYGKRPARHDLIRTIRRGAKGTSMPGFPWMSEQDLDAVVDYVMYLSLRGRVESMVLEVAEDFDEDEPIDAEEFAYALEDEIARWQEAENEVVNPISAEPADNEESVIAGRKLFIESSCYNCHGEDAEGQTEWLSSEFLAAQESAPADKRIQINYDAWGDPAPAADITARMLHGGRRPLDIYRRIHTGINGTPMPAFGDIFNENPDDIWHLVHYVTHIVEGGDPTAGISVADVKGAQTDE